MTPLEFPNLLLFLWILSFMYLKAHLIGRDTRLGWAMAVTNVALGTIYLYRVALEFWPDRVASDLVMNGLRLWVAVAVTWCVYELVIARKRWPSWWVTLILVVIWAAALYQSLIR